MTISERHIEMVRAVNEAKTGYENSRARWILYGFREAVTTILGGVRSGELVIDADLYYLNQGIDRPMCGGVWLDWKPAPDAEKGGER